MANREKLFGTDGIRGIANRYPMTSEIALQVGRATALFFKGQGKRVDGNSVILIGKDTRRSSYMIEQALAAGIMSAGARALFLGPMPTPGVAFLTQSMRADAGIMVSASHNTYEYNGIKIFGADGFKLPDEVEAEIERMVLSEDLMNVLPIGEALGRAKRIDDALGRYVVHAKSSFPNNIDLSGMRIVLDCAHGAAYKVAPLVFEELGAELVLLGNSPDGININRECGALHPQSMCEAVNKYRADLGIALDGDADRVILADDKGEVVDGDQIMAILAIALKKKGKLNRNTLVATQMSNMGLEIALKTAGIQIEYTPVGDRAVVEALRKGSYSLGGEQSGHLVFMEAGSTGDGIVAGLAVLAVMREEKEKLSDLRKVMTIMPQVLKNLKVARKPDLETLPEVKKTMDALRDKLGNSGRLLVRYSGTEPLCRVMIEGQDRDEISKMADELIAVISKNIS